MSAGRFFTPTRFVASLFALGLVALAVIVIGDWTIYYRLFSAFRKEASVPHFVLETPSRPDEAIVALTGDSRRIPVALDLLARRKSPVLVITGTGRGATLTDLVNQSGSSATDLKEIWQKVVLEKKAATTIENAEETAKILRGRSVHQVVLVTSDYHMPRSLAIFEHVIPDVRYLPYPVSSTDGTDGAAHSPSESQWRLIWTEFWKYFVFKHLVLSHLSPYAEQR